MKCNETLSKWCKNKHGASKIIDTFWTYQLCTWSPNELAHLLSVIRSIHQLQPLTTPFHACMTLLVVGLPLLPSPLAVREMLEHAMSMLHHLLQCTLLGPISFYT
jgi:hypothetical protein